MTYLNNQQQEAVGLRLLQIKSLLVKKVYHSVENLGLIILKNDGRILRLLESAVESSSEWLGLGTDDAFVKLENSLAAFDGHIGVFAIFEDLGIQRQKTGELGGRHDVGDSLGRHEV